MHECQRLYQRKEPCSHIDCDVSVCMWLPGIKLESGEHGLVSLVFPEHWFPVGNRTSQWRTRSWAPLESQWDHSDQLDQLSRNRNDNISYNMSSMSIYKWLYCMCVCVHCTIWHCVCCQLHISHAWVLSQSLRETKENKQWTCDGLVAE